MLGKMEFVNLIVTHLTARGVMEAGLLYEPPFTSYAPLGPDESHCTGGLAPLLSLLVLWSAWSMRKQLLI